MQLEEHGPETWVGLSADYEWGRIYGGQVIAPVSYTHLPLPTKA